MQAPVRIRDGLRVFVDRADALTPEQALRLTEHLTLRAMLRQAAEMPARRVQALRMRRVGSGPAK